MKRVVVPIALFLFLPLFGLAAPFLFPAGGSPEVLATGTLSHLWNYVLSGYIVSTLVLIFGVGVGVFILGVGNAWIIASYDFPGKKIFEWALILPLAVPTYVMAYLFVDLLQFSGPIQTTLRAILNVDSQIDGWCHLVLLVLFVSLCISDYPYSFFRAQSSFDRSFRNTGL
jgi:iron(III) transport system permease protein